ncbi:hypothetical protein SanaruYs_08060 [Chryseotalea sanaruensis]|uniref:DUF218 domain-containing protein n=1 Tax=Chryseotalea sanaruensis TaxID=2482724 RepID=A0A401U6L9_9BACT|nr:ElyC/SanA/YdcF family protein [Chryseotalea sanaruensis]GCC50591.1 hypothetical protein SanaruYs_08060 [Chryseotalea sanaruensis]
MTKVVNLLCNPLVVFIILLIASIGFYLLKNIRLAKYFLGGSIVWILVAGASPVPQLLIYELEKQFPVFEQRPTLKLVSPINILVLGSGNSQDMALPPSMRLSYVASARVVEGLRIYRLVKESRFIGSGNSLKKQTTIAEVHTLAALELGVKKSDTLQNRSPANTDEEILAYKRRFGTKGTLILVTNAYHMPRAVMLCKKHGVKVIPAPTGYWIKNEPNRSLFNFSPSPEKLEMMHRALHEYLGLIQVYFMD